LTTGNVKIHTYVPYCPKEYGQNLGLAYNSFMEYLKPDDWALFLDHDAMFTTRYWYHQIEKIIAENPDAGVFGACTNRIGNKFQIPPGIDGNNHDIRYHRDIGKKLHDLCGTQIIESTMNPPLSGVVILIRKDTWLNAGGFRDGFLAVDTGIQQDVLEKTGKKSYMMKGVYLYHWYRGDGDMSHLKIHK
jgi:hypothetical protein